MKACKGWRWSGVALWVFGLGLGVAGLAGAEVSPAVLGQPACVVCSQEAPVAAHEANALCLEGPRSLCPPPQTYLDWLRAYLARRGEASRHGGR